MGVVRSQWGRVGIKDIRIQKEQESSGVKQPAENPAMAGDVLKYSPCSEITDVHWGICVSICNLLLSLSPLTCLPHRMACHLVIHAHIDLFFFSKETTRLSPTWKHLYIIFCPTERTSFQPFLRSLTSLVSSLSLLSLLTLL